MEMRTRMPRVAACLLVIGATFLSSSPCFAEYGQRVRSRATFYGGKDAAGTMGGACGYGNLWDKWYNDMTAAASAAMWNSGGICGACFRVRCVDNPKYCRQGKTVDVTVTNQCPKGSEGGWCDPPQWHLDMAAPAWIKIANDYMGGIVETEMWRIPCRRKGGISVVLSGNPWFTTFLVYNVGGSGDIFQMSVSDDNGRTWKGLSRNWGEMWSGGGYKGKSLSFKFTNGLVADSVAIMNCVPSSWYIGATYQCRHNFGGGHRGTTAAHA